MNKRERVIGQLCKIVDQQQIDEMVYKMNEIFLTKKSEVVENSSISYVGETASVEEQCLNVYDEVNELLGAIEANDQVEIADALGDILTFGYGAIYILSPESPEKLISDYVPKINLVALDDIGASASVLQSMFSNLNTVGNIIEGILFAEYWAAKLKLDLLGLMRSVTKSNYTKLILTIEEAVATDKLYFEKGVESVYYRFSEVVLDGEEVTYCVIFSGADQRDRKDKIYRKDKFLKCIEFKEPCEFEGFNK